MKKTITKYGISRLNQKFSFERRSNSGANFLTINNTDDRDFFDTLEEAEAEKARLIVVYSKYEKHKDELAFIKNSQILEVKITIEATPAKK